jgi:hypothetical protein
VSDPTPTYIVGDELPSIEIDWYVDDQLLNFSTGYEFRLRIGRGDTATIEKTTGITGGATSPNITIDWTAGELDDLDGGLIYTAQLRARRTSDDKDRTFVFRLNANREMGAVPTPEP